MVNIAIFGSTGSIGRQTLEVLDALRDTGRFRLAALSGHRNLALLAKQAWQFRPRWVVMTDPKSDPSPRDFPPGTGALTGAEGLALVAAHPDVDVVVSAIVGSSGLAGTLEAVRSGKRVALANKESLVMGGALVNRLAAEHGAQIVPVDSEHSAIFQTLQAGRREELRRVILTASGGPFFRLPEEQLREATPEAALKHPTWNMGAKVTLDSATLMNKALEIVEARWLFDLGEDQLAVMIHPQSVVHSMVEFRDGAVIAQHSPPDMRLPIQYALTYPERLGGGPARRSDWTRDQTLEFFAPDLASPRFDALRLGLEVARRGGTAGVVMNAANERAVRDFMDGKIRFDQIVPRVRRAVEAHAWRPDPTLETLMELDRATRCGPHF